jgi:OOP family OmpA-OmpF porin
MTSGNKLISALSVLTLAAGCATPLPSEEPLAVSPIQFSAAEQRQVENIMIVTDASGSTYFAQTFPKNKALSQSFAKALPDRSARAASSNYNVGVIGFGGNERVTLPLQPFDRAKVESTIDQIEVMGSIDGMGGTTPIHAVIDEAGQQLAGQSGDAAIVLFTDGRADDPERALASAKALVEARPNTCFHAVQVSNDPAGAELLRQLGALSPCGSERNSTTVASAPPFSSFTKDVVVGEAGLPAVAAAPDACSGTIRLRGIEFAFDSSQIDPASAAVLDVAAQTLRQCGNVEVKVEGHTDWTGPDAYNQGLSERRAGSVSDYLSGTGVDRGRLEPVGYGESRPIAPNETRDGRAKNRRVELHPE